MQFEFILLSYWLQFEFYIAELLAVLLVHNIIQFLQLFHKLTQDEKKARDLAIDISYMPKKCIFPS